MPNDILLAAVEIGGTKFQIGIADSSNPAQLIDIHRAPIDRARGAHGILALIQNGFAELRGRYSIGAVGIGFGGPVDSRSGITHTSHQVAGWDDFPLTAWCEEHLQIPAVVANDCNVAALAEAHLGAGRGLHRMLYVTVGTGIGGGFIVGGQIEGDDRLAITEIGHLRPGLEARDAHHTVESLASGLGFEQTVRADLHRRSEPWPDDVRALFEQCQGDWNQLTTPLVFRAAAEGNRLAAEWVERAAQVLGWALAQATTLLAPDRIVLGGGVAQAGAGYFAAVDRWRSEYDFPPLRGTCDLAPASLGENVVLHGGILLAGRYRSANLGSAHAAEA